MELVRFFFVGLFFLALVWFSPFWSSLGADKSKLDISNMSTSYTNNLIAQKETVELHTFKSDRNCIVVCQLIKEGQLYAWVIYF